jgi:AcrR family transcriptional regulator
VVVERGSRGATVEAIAESSGAPTGSIYYRFRSVDELLARLWIRAVRRTHELVREAASADPVETVVAGALALYDFCLRSGRTRCSWGASAGPTSPLPITASS